MDLISCSAHYCMRKACKETFRLFCLALRGSQFHYPHAEHPCNWVTIIQYYYHSYLSCLSSSSPVIHFKCTDRICVIHKHPWAFQILKIIPPASVYPFIFIFIFLKLKFFYYFSQFYHFDMYWLILVNISKLSLWKLNSVWPKSSFANLCTTWIPTFSASPRHPFMSVYPFRNTFSQGKWKF